MTATERVDEFLTLIREKGGTAAALEEIERRAANEALEGAAERLEALRHPDDNLQPLVSGVSKVMAGKVRSLKRPEGL